jgi:hypothetical protein
MFYIYSDFLTEQLPVLEKSASTRVFTNEWYCKINADLFIATFQFII